MLFACRGVLLRVYQLGKFWNGIFLSSGSCKTQAVHSKVLSLFGLDLDQISSIRPFLPWFKYRMVYAHLVLALFGGQYAHSDAMWLDFLFGTVESSLVKY